MRWFALALALGVAWPSAAQESRIASDWRREKERIAENCSDLSLKKFASCAVTLATDYPFHVALGNLAPQNGFGFGLAFVERFTPNEQWRISWNADIVAAPSGSWRGAAYVKFIHTDVRAPVVVRGGPAAGTASGAIGEYPVFSAYAQRISLNKLFFFGLGQSTPESGKSVFRERQTIIGGSAIVPLNAVKGLRPLRPSLIGAVNGRFVDIEGNDSESIPSIDQLYDEGSAPGLADQPGFLELQEGIRFKPSVAGGRLRFNYLVGFHQFLTRSDAHASFSRWTLDLKHEIPLYRTVASVGPADTNGPDECFSGVSSNSCPQLTYSRNLNGSIGLRLLTTSSSAFSGGRVPFYFQPTLGGSDLNGQRLLASFDDYRFRGAHLIALQETFEHSVWGPIGAYFAAEQGKVSQRRADLNFSNLTHSFSIGMSIRAAGLPVMILSFAWGPEGRHVAGTMEASLLGGSSRASLY